MDGADPLIGARLGDYQGSGTAWICGRKRRRRPGSLR
jgi:hypothetical protein